MSDKVKDLCSLRPLIVLLCGLALILALGIAGNELVCRQTLYGARDAHTVAEWGAPPSPTFSNSTHAPSRHTVGDFVKNLSVEERRAWLYAPRYTSTGYRVTRLPAALRAKLQHFHKGAKSKPEPGNAHLHGSISLASIQGSQLEKELEHFLRRELESWTGQKSLIFTNSYGPRTYHRGSWLAAHGDRPRTHALSAIIYVGQQGLSKWPLQFVPVGASDESKAQDVVLSAVDDVLLYESTQPHGRVDPLEGESFSALFMHWRPQEWREKIDEILGKA